MKISQVTNENIIFGNGNCIWFDYSEKCCTYNYADFTQLEEMALDYEFDENLIFESVEDAGFRFGDKGMMFFIPCYSDQNGYYSSDVRIYYNREKVLDVDAPLV